MRSDSGYAYLPAGQAEVELAKHRERIRQLERQCAVLAEQMDRMRPVIDAAVTWSNTNYRDFPAEEVTLDRLNDLCDTYEQQMAQLGKECG